MQLFLLRDLFQPYLLSIELLQVQHGSKLTGSDFFIPFFLLLLFQQEIAVEPGCFFFTVHIPKNIRLCFSQCHQSCQIVFLPQFGFPFIQYTKSLIIVAHPPVIINLYIIQIVYMTLHWRFFHIHLSTLLQCLAGSCRISLRKIEWYINQLGRHFMISRLRSFECLFKQFGSFFCFAQINVYLCDITILAGYIISKNIGILKNINLFKHKLLRFFH